MRIRRGAVGAAVLLVVMGIAATGCSGSEDGGVEPTTAAEPWDPCSLSDAALQQAGLDPATEGPGVTTSFPGWKDCAWDGDAYGVTVSASATETVDHFRNFPGTIDFQEVRVAGRQAFTHREERDEPGTFCWLVVPFQDGGVMSMQVDRSPFTKDTTPMCEWAVRVGEALVPDMPA
ncbi:DUF3558 domain-containing protein [Rhodococcus sp. NPDC058521]|uniref:DUF3558 domain-containing protein n=1 Tax=Rhodococcus sp. NPDC058521 TaxID=3346536 RepID=UPI00364C4E74